MSATLPSNRVAAYGVGILLLSHQTDCAPAYIAHDNLCRAPHPPISADDPFSTLQCTLTHRRGADATGTSRRDADVSRHEPVRQLELTGDT
jgi:hypothetical protein